MRRKKHALHCFGFYFHSLLIMLCYSAAVSFMVAEQFGEAIEMEAITRAAKYGRMTGYDLDLGSELGFIVYL